MALGKTIIVFLIVVALTFPFSVVHISGDAHKKDVPATMAIPPKPRGWGPYQIGNVDVQIPRSNWVDVAARIYYPGTTWAPNAIPIRTGTPWSTVVFLSGGMDTYSYCNGITGMMASWGFVVVNVELANSYGNGLRNPYTMANETTDVLDYLVSQNSNMSFILNNTMDTNRFGVSGHSWGGLASGLAVTDTYGDPRFKAAAPISSTPYTSPTDYSKEIRVPLELMTGDTGDNNLQSLFDAGNPPVTYIVVHGATHGGVLSYPEWPISFFKYWLDGNTTYDPWVYLDNIRNDANITFKSKLFKAWGALSAKEITEDTTVTFTAGTVGRAIGAVNYTWDLDGDGFYDWGSNVTNVTHHTYTKLAQMFLKLKVKDRYETKDLTFQLNVSNVPPKAVMLVDNALVNVTSILEDDRVVFNASPSNDTPTDRPTLKFKWDLGEGTALPYPASVSVVGIYPKNGIYHVTLWAMDNDSAENMTDCRVIVTNVPPTVKASADIVTNEDLPVTLGGTGSDTPSDLAAGLRFRWDLGDGNSTDWSKDQSVSHTYTTAGIHVATIFVKDNDGAVTNDTMNITVNNLAPFAGIATPQDGDIIQKDEEVTFSGSMDDTTTDKYWLECSWDLGDGTVVPWGDKVLVTHTYAKGGKYDVEFSVRDRDGNVSTARISVNVINSAPKAIILSPTEGITVDEDSTVHLKANGTDTASDQGDLTVIWTVDGQNITGFEKDIAFSKSGTHMVLLTIVDPEGATSTASVNITVRNVVPTVEASVEPLMVFPGQPINFTAVGNDTLSDRTALTYAWDFGDGSPVFNGSAGKHTYTAIVKTIYTVTLEVKDDEGASVTKKFTVTAVGYPKPRPHDDGDGGTPLWAIAAAGAGIAVGAVIALLLLMRRRKPPLK